MPLPKALAGPRWRERTARVIFPWLLWVAKNHRTICYSDLDTEIVQRGIDHHVNFIQYGHPAGAVGTALLEIGETFGEEIPPLNALVVAKTGKEAGMPSEGCDFYLNKFLHRKTDFQDLSISDKRAIVGEVFDAIYSFKRWDDIQRYFSDIVPDYPELGAFDGRFKAIQILTKPALESRKHDVPWDFVPPPKFWERSQPESPEHRELKQYVADNPKLFGLPKGAKSTLEKTFGSGDRADVCFIVGDRIVVAEVKSKISDVNDICRGVFQCVKYRAVIRAHQKLKRVVPNGDAFLVVGKTMPTDIKVVADTLSVNWFDGIIPTADISRKRKQQA